MWNCHGLPPCMTCDPTRSCSMAWHKKPFTFPLLHISRRISKVYISSQVLSYRVNTMNQISFQSIPIRVLLPPHPRPVWPTHCDQWLRYILYLLIISMTHIPPQILSFKKFPTTLEGSLLRFHSEKPTAINGSDPFGSMTIILSLNMNVIGIYTTMALDHSQWRAFTEKALRYVNWLDRQLRYLLG